MLAIWLQFAVPQHALSRFLGWWANCRITWIKNLIIRGFVKRYVVDMSDAQQEDPCAYVSFNAFFTRQLKSMARPICHGDHQYAMPADGRLVALGSWQSQAPRLCIKGHEQSLAALIAEPELPSGWQQGSYAVIYLAPKNYHRVHMPFAGKLLSMTYVPGKLFSVNEATVAHIPGLFARNERLICRFATEQGELLVVMVGAMIVASMVTKWAGVIAPGGKVVQQFDYHDQSITFVKGDEIGYFQLGSTVIVINQQQHLRPIAPINEAVCMGQCLWVSD